MPRSPNTGKFRERILALYDSGDTTSSGDIASKLGCSRHSVIFALTAHRPGWQNAFALRRAVRVIQENAR